MTLFDCGTNLALAPAEVLAADSRWLSALLSRRSIDQTVPLSLDTGLFILPDAG